MNRETRKNLHALFRVWINIQGPKRMLELVREYVRRGNYPKIAIDIAEGAVESHRKQIPFLRS